MNHWIILLPAAWFLLYLICRRECLTNKDWGDQSPAINATIFMICLGSIAWTFNSIGRMLNWWFQ